MTTPRFLYHGSALAAGGTITRPYCENFESQAASVLPMVGGTGSAQVGAFTYRDVISFDGGWSQVAGNESGSEDAPVYNTLATAAVEGLNISGLLTADRVLARLVSEKPAEAPEVPIQPVGSSFTNLCVAGQPVHLEPNRSLFDCRTLPELKREGGDDLPSVSGGKLLLPEYWQDGEAVKGEPDTFRDHRSMTSLFRLPDHLPPGCERGDTPWSIRVPGFGTFYFGEILLSRYARRLTMLRVKMGSPVAGEVNFAYSEGNGTTYP